ncbi:hypothetical protein R6L23_16485 [Streptomyces sp. SR27]|uniref:hypothetical protein n=1 Tax=Streptomyces sp. SR27 TaxID=3076630 RepID=UPI00295BFC9A|nr:hypothetical protein [Streptomyces sp. SR27]MDV9189794.1 hypothetical protein [Streptomyces sp. SR27]
MLPTGTALAATPAPPTSASAAPAPDPTPEPTSPTPGPTTDPTPTAPPTAEPTPNPRDPTAAPCPVLPLAPFGDPGDAVGQVKLGLLDTACFTLTVEKSGRHWLVIDGGHPSSMTLSSGGTPVACPGLGSVPCELAAGTYTLDLAGGDYASTEARIAFVPLMAGPGCTGPVGTAFGTAPTTGTSTSGAGIVCHSFTAAPGELITSTLRNHASANVEAWITDSTGKRLCSVGYACVTPAGGGDYRVLARFAPNSGGTYPVPYTLTLRQVTHPVGCSVAGVTAYGPVPAQDPAPAECKTFTPARSGLYRVQAVTASGGTGPIAIYGPDGRVCEYGGACPLTAGVTYTLVADDAVRILDLTSAAEGCEDMSLGQPYRGALAVAHEVDCLNLPVPQGAKVAITGGPADGGVTPNITVLDATGTTLCWREESLSSGACSLGGTAPYRAIVERAGSGADTGSYGLIVRRTDVASDCRTFPAGDFGPNPAGATVGTGDGVVGDCLTIPADDHSARELIRTADGSTEGFTVLDEHGEPACQDEWGDRSDDCALTPGLSYTVLVPGGTRPAATLVRRDVTATARGCVATPATKAGAPALLGASGSYWTLVCHRVTTTDARDTLHLKARYTATGLAYGAGVYSANGDTACESLAPGCAVTGSTAYQAIVELGPGDATLPAYRFDAVRIGTAAGPAPECVRVPDITYGFGPLTGTLSEEKPTLCAVLPTMTGDWLKLSFAPAASREKAPTPWLYDGVTRQNACDDVYGYYNCVVPGRDGYVWVSRPTTLVIGMPSVPTEAPVQVSATAYCSGLCGSVEPSVTAVTPGTVGAGKITMTVTGTALHEKDLFEVTNASGSYRAPSTTVSVAADRRSMTIALDLTGAPLGSLYLRVDQYKDSAHAFGRVTVVAPLRSTAVPTVTGTAVIGGKVTASAGSWSPAADAYAYQWRVDGVAVAGATASTYTLPTALFGKQLSVAVTARKAGHPSVTAVSPAVAVKGLAPKPTRVPYPTGSARVGGKVSAVVGAWSPAPTSYGYQWRLNGVAVSGATGSSYVLPASALGKKVTVTVYALRTGHLTGAYTSAGYTVAHGLAPQATRAPYVTGTVKVGRTLSLNRGTWTPAPTSYTYQWYANGRAITGATKTWLTLGKAQRGTRITVKVTAYRTGHTAGVAWTRSTGAVAG